MESQGRAEPSPPAFSTPIALHNYGPGPRAIRRPRCFWPAVEPIATGTGPAGNGPHERQMRLESDHEPAAPLPWPPWRRPRYGKSFPDSIESEQDN